MTRKILFLTFSILFVPSLMLLFLNGCCGNYDTTCIYVNGLSLKAFDNADSTAHEPVKNEVMAKALLLRLEVMDSTVICYNRPVNSFVNTAYALSCKEAEFRNNATIRSYRLYSNKDFDISHPAGTDLFDLFYLDNKDKILNGGTFNYYCLAVPEDTGTHVFTAALTLSTGVTFTAQTQPIKLLK